MKFAENAWVKMKRVRLRRARALSVLDGNVMGVATGNMGGRKEDGEREVYMRNCIVVTLLSENFAFRSAEKWSMVDFEVLSKRFNRCSIEHKRE